jgi:hypothetical protein
MGMVLAVGVFEPRGCQDYILLGVSGLRVVCGVGVFGFDTWSVRDGSVASGLDGGGFDQEDGCDGRSGEIGKLSEFLGTAIAQEPGFMDGGGPVILGRK